MGTLHTDLGQWSSLQGAKDRGLGEGRRGLTCVCKALFLPRNAVETIRPALPSLQTLPPAVGTLGSSSA